MLLGLRAMVAAGAESVMVLYTGQQIVFRPEFKDGRLLNATAFEDYLREVQQRGKRIQTQIDQLEGHYSREAALLNGQRPTNIVSQSSLLHLPCACAGIHLNSLAILTAHQMGSARMGVSRQASAVDANGEAWDVQNLFVADAALMPTSTGDCPLCGS